jgi:hypothetical protein
VLLLRFWLEGFHFEEDISDLAGLVLAVVKLPDDPLLGRGDFSELLVGLDVGQLPELLDPVALSHVQLLDAPLLDLLAQVGQGEAEAGEGGGETGEEGAVGGEEGANHTIDR